MTLIWVLITVLSLGFAWVMLISYMRLDAQQRNVDTLNRELFDSEMRLQWMQRSLKNFSTDNMSLPPSEPPMMGEIPTFDATTQPPSTTSGQADLSGYTGILTRGSYSPDGKKYAGYDDVTQGKIGLGVESFAENKLRHVILFNRYSESSAVGTPDESMLSVRWIDNDTIQYDVMVKKADGSATKETREINIFF
ncbi:MAG: hypothetical protein RDU25_05245 [Patescibacteria group bacterium]|nr:hypothetical protein [Patescibacteria group bacterium]